MIEIELVEYVFSEPKMSAEKISSNAKEFSKAKIKAIKLSANYFLISAAINND